MNKKSKFAIFLSLLLVMIFFVTACGNQNLPSTSNSNGGNGSIGGSHTVSTFDSGESISEIDNAQSNGKSLGMSVTYDGDKTMMKFQNSQFANYNSSVDKRHYQSGDFKPAWRELQIRLNFSINDLTPLKASGASDAFSLLQAQGFQGVDIVNGPVAQIVESGTVSNTFVDLAQYRKYLPNLFKVINENEIVRQSVVAANGKVYYAPYFDGIDDVETMFICRTDWVELLLDDNVEKFDKQVGLVQPYDGVADGKITYDKAKILNSAYNGFYDSMNTSFVVSDSDVDNEGKAKTLTASDTHRVTVSYNSGEGIIARQNRLTTKNGEELVKALKDYIKEMYMKEGQEVISKPSDLFIGQNACYNVDELVALWRCVLTNPELLSGNASTVMVPFYPRHKSADRANQVLQLVQLWGVRGYESRNGYFYLDDKGLLQDARVSDDMMQALEYLHQIYQEGLICKDYSTGSTSGAEEYRATFNQENRGFMTYDYNQTTTIFNDIKDSYSYYRNISPVLYPVADWDNKAVATTGDANKYSVTGEDVLYQYTESWRSVKTEGWAILQSTANKADKGYLKKALEVLDYMYSEEGQILMTYGPNEWIEFNGTEISTIDYFGKQVPKISEDAMTELTDQNIGAGNYTNYYRYFVGSTLPIGFIKEQGMEYQAADEKGKVGLARVETAAKVTKTLKHASLTRDPEKVQNSLIVTTFPLSNAQSTDLATKCVGLSTNFNNSSAAGKNIFHDYVINGFNTTKTLSKEGLLSLIKNDYALNEYLMTYRTVYYGMYR